MNTTPEFAEPLLAEEPTYCAVHTTVETSLRCNKCGRYMCVRCAVRTPVGYRCKECVHQQQDVYFTASQGDYLIASAVSFGLALPIGYILPKLFLIGVIILSLPAGGLIAEVVSRTIGRRRGRYIWIAATVAVVLAAIVVNLPLLRAYAVGASDPRAAGHTDAVILTILIGLLPSALYVVLCVVALIARLRYGK